MARSSGDRHAGTRQSQPEPGAPRRRPLEPGRIGGAVLPSSFRANVENQPRVEARFPYVEATAGRINFKLGQVKKAFAFSDADFALWLESENEWGVRLDARPVRSDVPVSDTGTLRMEWSISASVRACETRRVNLKISFTEGPIGPNHRSHLWARSRLAGRGHLYCHSHRNSLIACSDDGCSTSTTFADTTSPWAKLYV